MKATHHSSKAAVLCFACTAFNACAPGAEEPPAPPQEALICPADGYLNCMPIVPPERQNFCSAEYRTWIVNNCPNVEIVY